MAEATDIPVPVKVPASWALVVDEGAAAKVRSVLAEMLRTGEAASAKKVPLGDNPGTVEIRVPKNLWTEAQAYPGKSGADIIRYALGRVIGR